MRKRRKLIIWGLGCLAMRESRAADLAHLARTPTLHSAVRGHHNNPPRATGETAPIGARRGVCLSFFKLLRLPGYSKAPALNKRTKERIDNAARPSYLPLSLARPCLRRPLRRRIRNVLWNFPCAALRCVASNNLQSTDTYPEMVAASADHLFTSPPAESCHFCHPRVPHA